MGQNRPMPHGGSPNAVSADSTTAFPVIVIAACAVACTASDKGAAARPTVTLIATDYAFRAPDTIPAGFTTFRLLNDGDQIHMALLVRFEEGKTLRDYLAAYGEAFRTRGSRPPWAKRLGGPGAANPHGTSNATQYLEPGSYAWTCLVDVPDGIPHVMKGMAKPFIVRELGAALAARTAPEADVVMHLLDYNFSLSTPFTIGKHLVRVENSGAEPHEAGLLKLVPGKTIQDLQAWIQKPQGPPPASPVGGISALAPGTEAYFEADLTPGDYVLLCFVTAPDGRSHIVHGMIQHIRIV